MIQYHVSNPRLYLLIEILELEFGHSDDSNDITSDAINHYLTSSHDDMQIVSNPNNANRGQLRSHTRKSSDIVCACEMQQRSYEITDKQLLKVNSQCSQSQANVM